MDLYDIYAMKEKFIQTEIKMTMGWMKFAIFQSFPLDAWVMVAVLFATIPFILRVYVNNQLFPTDHEAYPRELLLGNCLLNIACIFFIVTLMQILMTRFYQQYLRVKFLSDILIRHPGEKEVLGRTWFFRFFIIRLTYYVGQNYVIMY
eukprot:UN33718